MLGRWRWTSNTSRSSAGLTKIGGKGQYTAAVKKEVLKYVGWESRRRSDGGCGVQRARAARGVGERLAQRAKAEAQQEGNRIRPVEIAMPPCRRTLVLVLPGGARIEGLDHSEVVELAKIARAIGLKAKGPNARTQVFACGLPVDVR